MLVLKALIESLTIKTEVLTKLLGLTKLLN